MCGTTASAMTDILTLVFRTFMSQTAVTKELQATAPAPPTCSTLVLGDHSISRSLLLLAAVTAASEMGIKVMFFTQTQIQSLPVSLQKCFPNLSPESLKVRLKSFYDVTVGCMHG